MSSSENVAYCIWVHDSTPGHVNLIDSNRGLKCDRNGNIIRPAEYVLGYLGTDRGLGSPESSGDVLVTALGEAMGAWSAPINLTPDEDVQPNIAVTVADGAVHLINLNGGAGRLLLLAGLGDGGLEPQPSFKVIDSPLLPDPAVTGCVLSHQFAATGALVKAAVTVENLGLGCTRVDEQGRSVLLPTRPTKIQARALELLGVTVSASPSRRSQNLGRGISRPPHNESSLEPGQSVTLGPNHHALSHQQEASGN